MNNKNILITGATGGIGKESAMGLATMGATVYIVGRNVERGQQAEAEIRQHSGNDAIHFLPADLSTKEGIHQLVDAVQQRTHQLDVLINNAGGLYGERWLTSDGYEATWAMNHLSPVQLTGELLPLLESGDASRVINLTTSGHRFARIDFDNLQGERHYIGLENYGNAKLANLMVMYYWAHELKQRGVGFFAADPGGASTEMTDQMKPEYLPRIMRPLWPIMRLTFGRQNAEESRRKAAQSTIYAAISADLNGQTSLYISPSNKIVKSSRRSYDQVVQGRLWAITQEMLPQLSSQPA